MCVALNSSSKRTVATYLLASCGTNLGMQLWSLDMQYISLYNWAFLANGFAYYFSHINDIIIFFGNMKLNMYAGRSGLEVLHPWRI